MAALPVRHDRRLLTDARRVKLTQLALTSIFTMKLFHLPVDFNMFNERVRCGEPSEHLMKRGRGCSQ
jgi:hypothetical protein